jgi:hypothetical protein
LAVGWSPQADQPTPLTTLLRFVFWKTTRAYGRHGRPRTVAPAARLTPGLAKTRELLMTYQ